MLFIVINLEWLAWSTQGFSGYRSMFIWQILASIDKKYPISNSLVSVLDGQSMELMWHPLLSIQDTTETNSWGAPSEDSTVCISLCGPVIVDQTLKNSRPMSLGDSIVLLAEISGLL